MYCFLVIKSRHVIYHLTQKSKHTTISLTRFITKKIWFWSWKKWLQNYVINCFFQRYLFKCLLYSLQIRICDFVYRKVLEIIWSFAKILCKKNMNCKYDLLWSLHHISSGSYHGRIYFESNSPEYLENYEEMFTIFIVQIL